MRTKYILIKQCVLCLLRTPIEQIIRGHQLLFRTYKRDELNLKFVFGRGIKTVESLRGKTIILLVAIYKAVRI